MSVQKEQKGLSWLISDKVNSLHLPNTEKFVSLTISYDI